MSSTYYFFQLFTNVKHICSGVLWNSSKIKNIYNKYKIKRNKCQIKNKLPYRIGLRGIGNIIRTFKVQDMVVNDENLWYGIFGSTMSALHLMVHTTTQYTPAQLVFGRHSILNTRHEIYWYIIKFITREISK